jgi:hypothetical protein
MEAGAHRLAAIHPAMPARFAPIRDHQDEIDADIEAGERLPEELRPQLESPEARADLLERIAALRGAESSPN